jgi:hypothetical protein
VKLTDNEVSGNEAVTVTRPVVAELLRGTKKNPGSPAETLPKVADPEVTLKTGSGDVMALP